MRHLIWIQITNGDRNGELIKATHDDGDCEGLERHLGYIEEDANLSGYKWRVMVDKTTCSI